MNGTASRTALANSMLEKSTNFSVAALAIVRRLSTQYR
jgi:hypothetical protein